MGFKAKAKAAKPKQPKTKQPKPNPKPKAPKPKEYCMEMSDFSDPDHYRQYTLYLKSLEARGPFDLDFFADWDVVIFGLIYPCPYEEEDLREEVDKCVRHAIAYAKKEKKMELEDPKVVKANLQLHGGTMYYITFDATDKRSGKRQRYNTKALYLRGNRGIDVRLIRVKNSQKKCRGF